MSQSSFVCTQLNGSKQRKGLNISIWSITGPTTLGQSESGNEVNEEVPHICQSSRMEASLSNAV